MLVSEHKVRHIVGLIYRILAGDGRKNRTVKRIYRWSALGVVLIGFHEELGALVWDTFRFVKVVGVIFALTIYVDAAFGRMKIIEMTQGDTLILS